MKLCHRCGETKSPDAFYKSNRKKGGLQAYCKRCNTLYNRKVFQDNPKAHYARAKASGDRVKIELFNYLKDKSCVDCEKSDFLVLQFDHINNDKFADVSTLMSTGCSWPTILKEINKCEVVCANCHMIRTLTRANSWRVRLLKGLPL